MDESMSDERLAHLTAVFVDQDPRDWFAKDGLADVIRELLGEVKWARAELAAAREANALLRDGSKTLRTDLRTTNIRARTAEIAWSRQQDIIEAERRRAETAERELAEMRAKHQPGPNLHAWRRPDGYRVHGDEEWIRGFVKRYGGTFETAETCRYQGEWKAADG